MSGAGGGAWPDLLICAGLDPSGGAGLIADVRVASQLAVRPAGVVTALTVQDTAGVRSVHPLEAEVIGAQVTALLGDIEVRAVKLGMLGGAEIARELGRALHLTAAPVVWDPIGAPSLGAVAFDRGAFDDIARELGPHLTLVTPNAHELAALAGRPVAGLPVGGPPAGVPPFADLEDAIEAARAVVARLGAAVLAKGGHARGEGGGGAGGGEVSGGAGSGEVIDEVIDALVTADGVELLRGPRLPGGERVHGTGCALATAIAAHLARGASLLDACGEAKALVAARIAAAVRPGRGAAAIV